MTTLAKVNILLMITDYKNISTVTTSVFASEPTNITTAETTVIDGNGKFSFIFLFHV